MAHSVARMFPNEASLLRLVNALLAETSDEWASEKNLPQPGNQNPALSLYAQTFYRKKIA